MVKPRLESALLLVKPSLVSTINQSLDFDRITSQTLGILTQTPLTLGGKIFLVDFMVIEDILEFNKLLGIYCVNSMQVMVSTFLHVMYYNNKKENATIDQLDFLDASPHPN